MRRSTLYYLFGKNKLPLYVDDNGNVQQADGDYNKPDGQPAHLIFSPGGWKDFLIKFARNIKYWGIFRDMTVPMNFPKDGATILKNRMWSTPASERNTTLGAAILDKSVLPLTYKPWYAGDINFSKYHEDKNYVTVECWEGGLIKFIKSNESTVYTIVIPEDPDAKTVFMDGVIFDFNRVYLIEEDQEVIMLGASAYWLGMFQSSNEGNATDVIWQDILFGPTPGPYPNEDWIVNNSLKDRDIRIHGTIKVVYNKEVEAFVRAEVDDGHGSGLLDINHYILVDETHEAGTTFDITFDITIPVPAGNRVHIKVLGGNPSDSEPQFTINGGQIFFEYQYRRTGTFVQGFWVYDLARKIIDQMTGGLFEVAPTPWLINKKDIIITSGDALRVISKATIKTSLADLFKSVFGISSIYLAIDTNGRLVINQFADAFKDEIFINLGEVSEAFLDPAEDIMFNTLKTGGPLKDYEDVNGKYEFNQGQQWTSPEPEVVRELDLSTPYRRDPIGIELLRINFDNKTTSDSNSDNDTFMINIVPTEQVVSIPFVGDIRFYALYRPSYSDVQGLPHWETYFNIELTGKKSILTNGAYIHSLLWNWAGSILHQVSGDKNVLLSTTLAGVTVKENEDIQISTLPPIIFKAVYFSFKTAIQINYLDLMNNDPYRKVQFEWNNQQWFGFLVDGGLKPPTNEAQQWKLLVAPENDLSKFNKRG